MTIELVDVGTPGTDQWNRYKIPPAGGGKPRPYQRVTTLAGKVSDTYNLSRWQIRSALAGIIEKPELYARLAALRDPVDADKKAANELADKAKEAAGASRGADLGSALHGFTERVDRGEGPLVIPPPHDRDVAAYTATLAAAGVEIDPELVERLVILDAIEVAGTFDRIVTYAGRRYIADLKTGKDPAAFPHEICIQLALYAHANSMWEGGRVPMPAVDQDKALVMHLPPGKGVCELWWFDIAAGWAMVEHCLAVREYHKRRDLTSAFTTLNPQPQVYPQPQPVVEARDPELVDPAVWRPFLTEQFNRLLPKGHPGNLRYHAWRAEAAGTLEFDAPHTRTKYARVRAGMALASLVGDAEDPDDHARDGIALWAGVEVQPAVPVGVALGALTAREARRISDAIDEHINNQKASRHEH